MHIILGVLGAIVTILVLLNRLAEAGIDLGGLNPFLWSRRRKWKKMYQGNPIYQFTEPMEVTGILMVAVAKVDGDLSSEEKKKIKELYEQEFSLSRRDATGLLISSAHILSDGEELKLNLEKVISPSLENYSKEQVESTFTLLEQIAQIGGEVNALQQEFIDAVRSAMAKKLAPDSKWGQ